MDLYDEEDARRTRQLADHEPPPPTQAQVDQLEAELGDAHDAHDALADEYAALAESCAEQSAELARVTAAARAFLAMSTNITRAALAEAVQEEA